MTKSYIIDTNVPTMAAKGISDLMDDELVCASKCADFIQMLIKSKNILVVFDQNHLILNEYNRVIRGADKKHGLGIQFLDWIYANISRFYCEDDVYLHETDDGSFLEYPTHEGLKSFDRADRMFIALAYSHPKKPTIVQGSDGEWWGVTEILKTLGITVYFTCEQFVSEKYIKKYE